MTAFLSFVLLERAPALPRRAIGCAMAPTLVYGGIMLAANVARVYKGPYPFFYVYEQPLWVSGMWVVVILGGALLIAWMVWKLGGRPPRGLTRPALLGYNRQNPATYHNSAQGGCMMARKIGILGAGTWGTGPGADAGGERQRRAALVGHPAGDRQPCADPCSPQPAGHGPARDPAFHQRTWPRRAAARYSGVRGAFGVRPVHGRQGAAPHPLRPGDRGRGQGHRAGHPLHHDRGPGRRAGQGGRTPGHPAGGPVRPHPRRGGGPGPAHHHRVGLARHRGPPRSRRKLLPTAVCGSTPTPTSRGWS